MLTTPNAEKAFSPAYLKGIVVFVYGVVCFVLLIAGYFLIDLLF